MFPKSASVGKCYILSLPLLFLIQPCPSAHLLTRLLIPGTALLSSLISLIPFPLILLRFSLISPLNLSISSPCYALGLILPTASLSSTLMVLTETPQSLGSQLAPIRPMSILWYTLPFVTNMSALLTTHMVVTSRLSSYLATLSFISMDLLLIPFYYSLVFQLYLAGYCSLSSYYSLHVLACLSRLAIVPSLA